MAVNVLRIIFEPTKDRDGVWRIKTNDELNNLTRNKNIFIKMIKQLTSNTSYLLCVRLHVSVLMRPSSGLLANQVNKCWLHVGIPTMFTISTRILYLADKYIKFK